MFNYKILAAEASLTGANKIDKFTFTLLAREISFDC